MGGSVAWLGALGGLAGVSSLIGALLALSKAQSERRKIEAEREQIEAGASEKITQTALSLIEPLNLRIAAVERENVALRLALQRYTLGVRILIQQLREHEIDPAWTPEQAEEAPE